MLDLSRLYTKGFEMQEVMEKDKLSLPLAKTCTVRTQEDEALVRVICCAVARALAVPFERRDGIEMLPFF